MDHRGPEHHYNEIECPECGSFFQQGELQPETVHNNCPECGYDLRSNTGGRPYRGQPSEINSEMTERNTPLDGSSEDRGGNPLQEGIFANLKKDDEESLEEIDEATEPKGLGTVNPIKDNAWKSGEISDRSMGRDEMVGSVRRSSDEEKSEDELWDKVVEDFEHAKGGEVEDPTEKIAAASWLKNDGLDSNIPVEHLGWDIVDVVEPSKEHIEAANKYSMPLPKGITDNLHEALIKLNAWVENPDENGKLRPYKDYWSVIRPKVSSASSIQIGVENPHMADIINDVARTDNLSALDKTSHLNKISEWTDWIMPAAIAAGTILAPEIALPLEGAALAGEAAAGGAAVAEAAGAAGAETAGGELLSGVGNLMRGALGKKDLTKELAKSTGKEIFKDFTGWGSGPGATQQQAPSGIHDESYYAKTAYVNWRNQILAAMRQKIADRYRYVPEIHDVMTPAELAKSKQERKIPESEIIERQERSIQRAQETGHGTGVSTGPKWKGIEPTERRQPQIPGTGTTDVPGRFMLPKLKMPIDPTTGEEVVGVDAPMSWEVEGYGQEEPQQQVQQPQSQPQTQPAPQTQNPQQPQQPQPQAPAGGQDGRGKWLGYGMGAIPGIYNWLFNNPNKALQTKPWELPVRGEDYFAGPRRSSYGDQYEHPSSITRRIEDPINGGIDPHQRTDESNDDWAYDMLDVNEIGQSRDIRGDDYEKHNLKRKIVEGKNEDSKEFSNAIEQFLNFLPLIMEFFYSEKSGLNHPTIKLIHENLESEHPGYLDLATTEGQNKILLTIDEHMNKKSSATTVQPQVNQQIPSIGVSGICPKCGNEMGPDQICQQCSPDTAKAYAPAQRPNITLTPELNVVGRTASDTQGPHTDEQQAAVAEMLIEQGREDEIPNMLENPADYDNELAEIQNKDPMLGEDPEDIGMSPQEQMQGMGAPGGPAGMPGMDGGMPGMPPGPPGAAPGIPDMGAPTPADLNPAGPGAMQPPVMASMLHAAFKYGADNVAGKCPKCDGHTTKMVQQDGKSRCHSCGHQWKDETYEKADGDSSNSSTTASFYQALNLDKGPEVVMPNPVDSFSEPEEESEIDDSSHTWTDENGEPLEEGQEYEIYAHDYEIPDVGRVKEIKPDAVVYEIESDGGLRTTIEIDRQEADLNGYRFAPTSGGSEDNPAGIEENLDTKNVTAPGQDSDLSTPHIQIGSSTKEANVDFWACPQPNCQFNIQGGDTEPGTCPYHDVPLVKASEELMQKIYSEKRMQDAARADLQSFTHVAGKHYTPMEQRELIDEYGEARNADKLNLEGTHYAESDPDYFLFGC